MFPETKGGWGQNYESGSAVIVARLHKLEQRFQRWGGSDDRSSLSARFTLSTAVTPLTLDTQLILQWSVQHSRCSAAELPVLPHYSICFRWPKASGELTLHSVFSDISLMAFRHFVIGTKCGPLCKRWKAVTDTSPAQLAKHCYFPCWRGADRRQNNATTSTSVGPGPETMLCCCIGSVCGRSQRSSSPPS